MMLEYLYLSILDDGAHFEFASVDTLIHPLDFLREVADVRKDHRQAAEMQALNNTEVYGCFGPSDEVSLFEGEVLEEACGLRTILTSQPQRENRESEAMRTACVEIFARAFARPDFKMGVCRRRDLDTPLALFLLMDGKTYPSKEYCQAAIEQLADAWLEQEEPFLFHRQVMTNGFMIRGVTGKRIIAPHFNSEKHKWELLLEGARRLGLQGDLFYVGEQTDSSIVGSWTEPDVESILLNPVYGFGICLEPQGVVEDWSKAPLYCYALSFYAKEWDAATLEAVYLDYLEMLKKRFAFVDVPPIAGKNTILRAFRELARSYADSLRGIRESELTRRFASEMPSRVYQLKALKPLLEQRRVLQVPQKERPFNRVRFSMLLDACNTGSAARKGRALEDAVAYMLDSLSDWRLAGKRVRADDCEIDLCYVNQSFAQETWDLGCMLLVECKNRSEQTGVSVVRNLSFVMDAKGAKAGLIASTSIFTKVAQEQVRRLATQSKIIFLVDGSCLRSIASGRRPNAVLADQYASLMRLIEDDFGVLC